VELLSKINATGYIHGINFSMNSALKTTYFDTKSFVESIKAGYDALNNFRRLNLEKNSFGYERNTVNFVEFLRHSRLSI
jgi:hypothetical protein